MDKIDLAYVAGLVDGEGSIYITSCKGAYEFCVAVRMTAKLLPEWLKESFGGGLTQAPGSTIRAKESYRWGVSAQKAKTFVEQVLPYLKLKIAQANLGLAFQQTKIHRGGHAGLSEEVRREQDMYYKAMRELNRRGV